MTRIVSPMPEGKTDFAASKAKRERSRLTGRLPQEILDEECEMCGRPFVPIMREAQCRRCRLTRE